MEDTARLESFKAYDVRGKVPEQLNDEMAELIGRAYAELIHPSRVVVGHDIRLTSPELTAALSRGLVAAGVDVVDIGLVGTEEVYFATFSLGVDGGIMVTASHNPRDYNGMKFTRDQARPISSDTGLLRHRGNGARCAARKRRAAPPGAAAGPRSRAPSSSVDMRPAYVEHLLTYIDPATLRPLKVVVNPGNGGAGPVIDLLEPHLPLQFVKMNDKPDGTFPHRRAQPPAAREPGGDRRRPCVEAGADLGIAWDGDFDRCFFFDEKGEFVDGYYLVGLLAQRALQAPPRGQHHPRPAPGVEHHGDGARRRAARRCCARAATPSSRRRCAQVDAAYGGEMSAHHYFREFSYCDSGHDPLAAGGRGHQRGRAAALRAGGRAHRALSRSAARST